MDARNIVRDLEIFSGSGHKFSSELQSQVINSLTILKHNNKFKKLYLWGRILGLKEDYLIATGIHDDSEFQNRTFHYSTNGNDWHLLSFPDTKTKELAMQLRDRFIGDAMHEYEFVSEKGENEEGGISKVKEEDRLCAVIDAIDREAMIVPRGSFFQCPSVQAPGRITENSGFSGLTEAESKDLNCWLHFHPDHVRANPAGGDLVNEPINFLKLETTKRNVIKR